MVADKHRVARDARPVPGGASLREKLRYVHRAAKERYDAIITLFDKRLTYIKTRSKALTNKEKAYEHGEVTSRSRLLIERSKVLERLSFTFTRSLRFIRALFNKRIRRFLLP
jgi:hypothetical protein